MKSEDDGALHKHTLSLSPPLSLCHTHTHSQQIIAEDDEAAPVRHETQTFAFRKCTTFGRKRCAFAFPGVRKRCAFACHGVRVQHTHI